MTRTDALKNSEAANAETTSANSNNTAKSHGAAASLHLIASESHKLAGDDELAQKHATLAADHTAAASRCAAAASNKVGAQPAAAAKDATKVYSLKAAARKSKNAALQASVTNGGFTLNNLQEQVRVAVLSNPTLTKTANGVSTPCTPWVCDIIAPPNEAGENWKAVVQGADGNLYAVEFTVGNGAITVTGDPSQVERTTEYDYINDIISGKDATATPTALVAAANTAAAARMAANAALCASVASGGWSLNDLQTNVREAISDVDVLNEPAAEGNKCCGAWVCDIVAPVDDDDDWTAIVNGCNGKLYAVDFDVDDDGSVELDGDPQEVERSTDYDYVNDIMAACAKEAAGLNAGGPGSGRHKEDSTVVEQSSGSKDLTKYTGKEYADKLSERADEATKKANTSGDAYNHAEARTAHESAAMAQGKWGSEDKMKAHNGAATYHWGKVVDAVDKNQAKSTAQHFADLHNAGAGGVGGKSAGGKDGLQATATQQGTTAKSPNVDLDRVCALADMATEAAGQATDTATSNPNPTTHQEAADAHSTAYDAHKKAYQAHMVDGAKDDELQHHMMQMQEHMGLAAHHKAQSEEFQSRAANQDAHNALNASIRDSIQAGDYPGHPFRGNQFGAGSSGGMAGRASAKAHDATKSATDRDSHKAAAAAHIKAAKLQAAKGNADTAEYHNLMAAYHTDAAKESAATNQATAQSATSAAVKQTGAAVKSDTKADHQAARMAHKKAQAANKGESEGDSAKAAGHKTMAEHHHHMSMGRIPASIGGRDHKKKKETKAMDTSGKDGLQAGGPGSGRHAGGGMQSGGEMGDHPKGSYPSHNVTAVHDNGTPSTTQVVGNKGAAAATLLKWHAAGESEKAKGDTAWNKPVAHGFITSTSSGESRHYDFSNPEHVATLKKMASTKETKAADATTHPTALAAKSQPAAPAAANPAAASIAADQSSKDAAQSSAVAEEAGTQAAHETAAEAHDKAHTAHMAAYAAHTKAGSDDTILDKHMAAMADHKEQQNNHAAAALDACNASNGTPDKAIKAGDESSAAYQEGENADEGDSNPYDANSEDGQDWQAGYDSAHDLDASGKNVTAALEASAHAALECYDAASNFKTFATEEGVIMYMPAGVQTITPSQAGRPVTVTLDVDAGSAAAVEQQRKALTAKGKKPFFSIQHASEVAGFWPSEFFWDTRVDATGKTASGVWAKGTWSASGKAARDGKDFRTFSPTFFVDAVKNDPDSPAKVVCNVEARANMGALENDPAFQAISPLWARNAAAGNKQNNELKAAVAACHKTMTGFSDTFTLADMASALNRNGFNVTEDDVAKNLV